MIERRRPAFRCDLLVAVMVVSALGCSDQSLGDIRARDGAATNGGAPTCAALGGTCGAATVCAVGQGHLAAAATSDCSTSADACCLPESACPTETFMCCETTASGAVVKSRPLCRTGTAAGPTLACASGTNPC